MARLRVATIRCEVGTATDAEFKKQIIRGFSSSKLRQHILEALSRQFKRMLKRVAEASFVQTMTIDSQNKVTNEVKQESIVAVVSEADFR